MKFPGGGRNQEKHNRRGEGNGYIGSHLRKADKARERGWQSAVFGTSVARPSRGGRVFPLLSPSHPLILSSTAQRVGPPPAPGCAGATLSKPQCKDGGLVDGGG